MKQCKYCTGLVFSYTRNFSGWCCPQNYMVSKVKPLFAVKCKYYTRKRRLFLCWWIPKVLLITLALLLGGCSSTTAEYKDGVASIKRIRILMTEDIDSFSYDATDGSFILEGYKSDMTRLLMLVDKLITREDELRRKLIDLGWEVEP